jgi:hypothetical protein
MVYIFDSAKIERSTKGMAGSRKRVSIGNKNKSPAR